MQSQLLIIIIIVDVKFHLLNFSLITLKVLISIVLLGKSCDYIKESKKAKDTKPAAKSESASAPSPPSKHKNPASAQSRDDFDLKSPGLHRRSKSVGRDLNVTFSNTSSFSDVSLADTDTSLNRHISMTKPMFSNSTVSLQSVGLNEDFIKDSTKEPSTPPLDIHSNALKQRKSDKNREPPKPLSEVDRYTMCSNRII